jgi:hypothetical protein
LAAPRAFIYAHTAAEAMAMGPDDQDTAAVFEVLKKIITADEELA